MGGADREGMAFLLSLFQRILGGKIKWLPTVSYAERFGAGYGL